MSKERFYGIDFFEKIKESKKFSNRQEWFKKRIDAYIGMSKIYYSSTFFGRSSQYDRFRALALLANGMLDKSDLQTTINPIKEITDDIKVGRDIPDDFTHKDILSSKINMLMAMEANKPWAYRALAYNKEVTNKKLKHKEELMRSYLESIMREAEASVLEEMAEKEMPQKEEIPEPPETEPTPPEIMNLLKQQGGPQQPPAPPQEQMPPIPPGGQELPPNTGEEQATPPQQQQQGLSPEEVLMMGRSPEEARKVITAKQLGQQQQTPPTGEEQVPPPTPEQQAPIPQEEMGAPMIEQPPAPDKEQLAKMMMEQAKRQKEMAAGAMPPEEIDKYMARTYKDASEIFANHILEYSKDRHGLKTKFLNGLKHSIVFGREIYYVDIVDDNVIVENVNPIYFDFEQKPGTENIEDSEWAVRLIYMSPTDIIQRWGDELTRSDMEKLSIIPTWNDIIFHDDLSITENFNTYAIYVPVFHVVWCAMRQVRVVKYVDENGVERETIVDPSYTPMEDEEYEDIWIREVYEGYKIFNEVHVGMGYCKSSATNIDNPRDKKLPYIGRVYSGVSILERAKMYQYLYDVLMYKLERLISQDMNKKVFINMNMIPDEKGTDMSKFLTILHRLNIGFMNPQTTGQGLNDIAAAIKEVDMSPTFDLRHIMEIMNIINSNITQLFGIQVDKNGSISFTLEELNIKREETKRCVMDAMIDAYRKAIALSDIEYLSYVTDDLDIAYAQMHSSEFIANRYHVYIDMDRRTEEITAFISQHAAELLKAGMLSMADFIKVARAKTLQEAEEIVRVAEQKREQMQQQAQQAEQQMEQMRYQHEKEMEMLKHKLELQRLIVNNRERRKTIRERTILQNYQQVPSEDINKNKVPDAVEIYNATRDAELKEKEIQLKQRQIEAKEKETEEKAKIEREWMKIQKEATKNKENRNKDK